MFLNNLEIFELPRRAPYERIGGSSNWSGSALVPGTRMDTKMIVVLFVTLFLVIMGAMVIAPMVLMSQACSDDAYGEDEVTPFQSVREDTPLSASLYNK